MIFLRLSLYTYIFRIIFSCCCSSFFSSFLNENPEQNSSYSHLYIITPLAITPSILRIHSTCKLFIRFFSLHSFCFNRLHLNALDLSRCPVGNSCIGPHFHNQLSISVVTLNTLNTRRCWPEIIISTKYKCSNNKI